MHEFLLAELLVGSCRLLHGITDMISRQLLANELGLLQVPLVLLHKRHLSQQRVLADWLKRLDQRWCSRLIQHWRRCLLVGCYFDLPLVAGLRHEVDNLLVGLGLFSRILKFSALGLRVGLPLLILFLLSLCYLHRLLQLSD